MVPLLFPTMVFSQQKRKRKKEEELIGVILLFSAGRDTLQYV